MIVKSRSLLVQTWGAAILMLVQTQGAAMFFSGRRHVSRQLAPAPCWIDASWGQFRGTRGLGSALVFRRLPAIACNGSRTPALVGHCVVGVCVGVPTAFHTRQAWVFLRRGLVCSAELASGVGEMIASLINLPSLICIFVHSGKFRVPDTAYSGWWGRHWCSNISPR